MKNLLWRVAVAVLSLSFAHASLAQQAVLQRGYDPGLSGANLAEATLTTANVTPTTFGLLRTPARGRQRLRPAPVRAERDASSGKGAHNVLYVASMSDTLYAFDADSGAAALVGQLSDQRRCDARADAELRL